MDVNDLTVLVEGLNGTEVKHNGAAAQFANSFTTAVGQFPRVPAHQGNAPVLSTGSPFHFEAPNNPKPAGTQLVRVSVAGLETPIWPTRSSTTPTADATAKADLQLRGRSRGSGGTRSRHPTEGLCHRIPATSRRLR